MPSTERHRTPSEVVPQEILRETPDEICRYRIDGYYKGLVVIWRLGGNTYAIAVRDSRHDLYDVIETKDGFGNTKQSYRLNDHGRNFRQADRVINFIQIRGTPEIFSYPPKNSPIDEVTTKRGKIYHVGYFYPF